MENKQVNFIKNTNAFIITEKNDNIDILDRKSFIEQIIKVIEHYADKKQSASFSIQGSWGSGKSWIINNIVTELYNMQDIDISGGKYCVLKFNPWEYDYYNEPLLSLILSLKNQVNSEKAVFPINKEHIQMFKDSMEIFSNELVEPVFDFISIVSGNTAVSFLRKFFINKTKKIKCDLDKKSEDNKKQKRYINPYIDLEELMRITVKGLNEISKNKTVIVLIDELDRCLPEYAIKVLERMHHITQNVQNFQIIYSIDKGQIEETVHKIYGSKIDSKEYLKKFISFGFNLSVGNLNHNFIKRNIKLFNGFDFIFTDNFDIEIAFSSILPEITMRERENIIEKITLINNILNTKNEVYVNWYTGFEDFHTSVFGKNAPQIQLDIMAQLKIFVEKPNNWAIVPISVARGLQKVSAIRILQADFPLPERTVYCLRSKERQLEPLSVSFLQCLGQILSQTEDVKCLLNME